jgi:transcriptional regulator with XRE-family HTH domain
MAAKDDIREFLTTRRAKITPDQAGLPVYGANRRVTGLRREEVALLAGISVEYYTRLERGSVGSVSDGVLDGLVHALQLDDAERDHLYRLVRTASTSPSRGTSRRTPTRKRVRPTVQRILDQMPMPAYLRNGRFDVLAANDLGRALYSPLYEQADAGEHPNSARFVFLDAAASEFFLDYEKAADDCVAFLRAEAGRDPYSKELSDLVGELSTRSEDFRRRWSTHNVRLHGSGVKHFHHRVVGELTLAYESLDMVAEPGLTMTIYAAEPNSATADALALLASWAATHAPATVQPT